ncbi:ubiquitin carboxyl-terminal hydrolase 21 isoform X4 [Brachypodium distachyon]|uniref:USP domain-containing protein n=1 Tax=Brachypodium distachyon TaxID=15368 RepID=A0A0Q3ICB6_BRADI|nr:ubiquitin carboxyl-terminal hydrolase 21 isoform X4 [Brachypodium distachyon]KQJ97931.1 hypothetical protein BRADI_3g34174v3 [Brachypodium distachyon]|eukprot:XP_010235035.1 ubiquitin carboxyl-terminal hydrolase 21 isoform X4 [Brachypodium distachyon]
MAAEDTMPLALLPPDDEKEFLLQQYHQHLESDQTSIHETSSSIYVDTPCCSLNLSRGKSDYPVGGSLENPHKWTCFINCILQCVVHTGPLVSKLLKDDHIDACLSGSDKFCCYCSLKLHAIEVIKLSGLFLYPRKFVKVVQLVSANFESERQQDAHEFLRFLLNKLDEASVPSSSPSERPISIVKEIFRGLLKSQLHCPGCNHCSDKLEPFLDLSLEVNQMDSVMDALHSFTKIEVVENFICDGCKSCVNMEKHFEVEQAPKVLVIQLKRFQILGTYISKIESMVKYQLELDLNPFMSSPDSKPQNYDLYAVVEHSGVPCGGHYVSYIHSSQTDWFLFDDDKVMKINEEDKILGSSAYLLFYVKQGSPWFSTLLEEKNMLQLDYFKELTGFLNELDVSSEYESDEDGDIYIDDDEQEYECFPESSSWREDEMKGYDDAPAGALHGHRRTGTSHLETIMEMDPEQRSG